MIANENKAVFTKLINGSLVQVQLGEPLKRKSRTMCGSSFLLRQPEKSGDFVCMQCAVRAV